MQEDVVVGRNAGKNEARVSKCGQTRCLQDCDASTDVGNTAKRSRYETRRDSKTKDSLL